MGGRCTQSPDGMVSHSGHRTPSRPAPKTAAPGARIIYQDTDVGDCMGRSALEHPHSPVDSPTVWIFHWPAKYYMTSKVIILTIKSQDPSDMHLNEKGFGTALQDAIQAQGGKCVAKWANETLTVYIENVDISTVRPLVKTYEDSAIKHRRRLNIMLVEQEAPSGFTLPLQYCGPGAIRIEKLTKKLFFQLPTGAYVVSSLYPNGRSAFAEQMGAPATRPDAWKRAVAAGAAQRLCQILDKGDDFSKTAFPRPGLCL